MKIGVSTLALYPQPLEEVLESLEERNIDYCEIINEYPYHELDEDLLDSYQIELTVHSPLSDINLASHNQSIRDSSIEEVKKSMDRAVQWNADLVVVHPGSMPIMGKKIEERIFKYNLESLKECADYARDSGIYMCVENMPVIESLLYQDLNELNSLLEELDVYMTLDVGHAHNSGFSPSQMFSYPRIKHVHLSDNDGTFDQHNALSSGSIDFDLIFKNIEKSKYDGILVVEVKDPKDVITSLDFITKKGLI
ncbi:sugar phosphate isomerase/epimerase [Methanobacterium formicicum]|uniref:Xylose isomerase domain-containing protein n=1 Tax=Methanobacterium formicicum (strain DSM 3637 / PP1) TaxID=1204725 RepID=K2R2Q8_METFP|nr:sugar phosphate isomerase/epimerase family protein [Methanobacterium formicicum]EKF85502.1 xylose isomerase domain-containing protein [Methanobacterium formicicum DSM 3637]